VALRSFAVSIKKFIFLGLVLILQGCAGGILATSLVGAYFIGSFSSVSDIKNEYRLQKKISSEIEAIKKVKEGLNFNIEVTVYSNGIYLIGIAENLNSKRFPLDYVSNKYGKSKKIIDEVRIERHGLKDSMKDYLIKSKIKTKFIFTNGIRYGNYNISVFSGNVFIIGAAADKYEASKILDIISSTIGVKKVMNYVEVKDIGD
jgi:osmotically-inducible protein OsmY